MNKIIAVALGIFLVSSSIALAKKDAFQSVTLCHQEGNGNYVTITVNTEGQLNGHSKHEGDIIPKPENGCPVPPKPAVYEWSEWGVCSATCGGGTQTRTCEKVSGDVGEPNCEGPAEQSCNTQACEEEPEPTCEELQNCPTDEPEEPPVTPPTPPTPPVTVKKSGGNATLRYSQGPNGRVGDSFVQLEWKNIKGSKRVEIAYTYDCVFGNGAHRIKTKDDGAYPLTLKGKACVKIRGLNEKGGWSKVLKVTP